MSTILPLNVSRIFLTVLFSRYCCLKSVADDECRQHQPVCCSLSLQRFPPNIISRQRADGVFIKSKFHVNRLRTGLIVFKRFKITADFSLFLLSANSGSIRQPRGSQDATGLESIKTLRQNRETKGFSEHQAIYQVYPVHQVSTGFTVFFINRFPARQETLLCLSGESAYER